MEYIKITNRSELDKAQVAPGHALLFSEDGASLTAKMPDGTYNPIGGGGDLEARLEALEAAVGTAAEDMAAMIGEE